NVYQFQGQWLRLDRDNQSAVGAPGGNNQLNVSLVAGARVWDVQGKIRVRLGPLSAAQFREFLPDSSRVQQQQRQIALLHLVRLYVGPELDFDVQLALAPEHVPECKMPEGTGFGPQLGWNSWISSQTHAKPAEDAVFEGDAITSVN